MRQFLFLILTFVSIHIMAQNRPETYNYKRGVEAVQNEKNDEALDFFNKDLADNPKNGYSYSWVAWLRLHPANQFPFLNQTRSFSIPRRILLGT